MRDPYIREFTRDLSFARQLTNISSASQKTNTAQVES